MTPQYFETPEAFRRWLQRHGDTKTELLVGFYKVDSGKPSMTWPQSVDEALCVGWIDGVRRRIDDQRYSIRFTPRKPGSIWSAINIDRVAVLSAENRMQPAGLAAFARRSATKSRTYAYEQKTPAELDAAARARFEREAQAWSWFQKQAAGYRQRMVWWVISAKAEATRERRLLALIEASGLQRRL